MIFQRSIFFIKKAPNETLDALKKIDLCSYSFTIFLVTFPLSEVILTM